MESGQVTCAFCSHVFSVPPGMTEAICPECGNATPYMSRRIGVDPAEIEALTRRRKPTPPPDGEAGVLARIALRRVSADAVEPKRGGAAAVPCPDPIPIDDPDEPTARDEAGDGAARGGAAEEILEETLLDPDPPGRDAAAAPLWSPEVEEQARNADEGLALTPEDLEQIAGEEREERPPAEVPAREPATESGAGGEGGIEVSIPNLPVEEVPWDPAAREQKPTVPGAGTAIAKPKPPEPGEAGVSGALKGRRWPLVAAALGVALGLLVGLVVWLISLTH